MTSLLNDLINSGISQSLLPLLAQSSEVTESTESIDPVASIISTVIFIILYCFISYCTQTFLKKLGYEKAWYAWIPIANTYAILEAGEQENPLIWTIVGFIPTIGLISLIKIIPAWITICNRLGKSPAILWTVLLCGIGALLVPGILAFT
jgi:hypothetical protein